MFVDKKGVVGFAVVEANSGDKSCETIVPSSRCLFETVEGLTKKAYMVRKLRVTVARRLVHSFVEVTMKKGVFDIKLVNRPIIIKGKSENCADSAWFHNGAESFIAINAKFLRAIVHNEASFVAVKGAICFCFDAVSPKRPYDVGIRRWSNKVLSFILD